MAQQVPSSEESEWLSIEQAAEHIGMTVRWLRRRVDEKSIRHYKPAGLIRFRIDDLDAFMEAAVVEPERKPRSVGRPRSGSSPSESWSVP